MRTTILRFTLMGLGALLVSGCMEGQPISPSSDDDASLPSGNPVGLPPSSPNGTQPLASSNAPVGPSKKTSNLADNSTSGKIPPAKKIAPKKTAPPKASETADTTDADASFDNLELVGSGLGRKLAVLRVASDRTDSNLLSVVAGLKNKTGHDLEIEVQTIYKDKSSTPLSAGTGSWIPIKLKPHESTDYRSVALSSDAVDFLVRVRLPQK